MSASSRRASVIGLLALALLAGAGTVAQQVDAQPYPSSVAWHDPVAWLIVFVAGGALALAATGTAAVGRGGLAQLALLAGWLAPLAVAWEAGPTWLRSLALAVSPLTPLAAVASARPLTDASPRRGLWIPAVAISLVASGLLLLAYQPFRDVECFADCADNPWAATHIAAAPTVALALALLAAVMLGSALMAGAARGGAPAVAKVGAAAALCVAVTLPGLSWSALAHSLTWLVGAALSLLALSSCLLLNAAAALGRRRRVRSLVEILDAAPDPHELNTALARALGGPVVIAYPDPSGRGFLNAAGCAAEEPGGDRLEVWSRGAVVAVIGGPGAGDHALSSLDPAIALLVENSSATAALRAQVIRLQDARLAVVAAHDEARARLERDLHDGAQQLVLALGIDLRLLVDACPADAPERALAERARDEVGAALAELRAVAHGLHPATLTQTGLEAACEVLTERTGVRISVEGLTELPTPVLMATYRLVETAAQQTAQRGCPSLAVAVEDRGDEIRVSLSDGTREPLLAGAEADRVAALGGHLRAAPVLEVVLPLAVS